jgi:hypothetical protein
MALQTMIEVVSGGTAGALGIISTQPIDTARVRIQMSSANISPSVVTIMRSCVAQEGVGSLWKGVGAPVSTQFAAQAVNFAAYKGTLNWSAACCWPLFAGCSLLAADCYWLLAAGCYLLVAICLLLLAAGSLL